MIIGLIFEVDSSQLQVDDTNARADTLRPRMAITRTKKPPIICKENENYKNGRCRQMIQQK